MQAAVKSIQGLPQQLAGVKSSLDKAAAGWQVHSSPEGSMPASTVYGPPLHAYGLPRPKLWPLHVRSQPANTAMALAVVQMHWALRSGPISCIA